MFVWTPWQILYFGGIEVMHGKLEGGYLISFLLYQSSLTDGLNSMASVFGGLATAVGAAEKVGVRKARLVRPWSLNAGYGL